MQEALTAITLASTYLLFSLGMSLTWGTIDILNFAHGSIFMFSAFGVYLILGAVRLPFVAVVLLGVIIGAAMSVAIQILAFEQIIKRARNKRGAEMQILIGGIGVATIPLAIAEERTKSNPFGLNASSFQVVNWVGGGLRTTNADVFTIVLAIVLWTAITLWLRRSKHGLALRSIGVDAETASLMGVDRRRLALVSMAVAGGLAGLAGVMYTYTLGAITPDTGDTLLVKAFAIVVLGGVGSMAGVAVGALILGAAEVIVLDQTSGSWVDAISFGLIFLVLLARPSGLFGRKEIVRS